MRPLERMRPNRTRLDWLRAHRDFGRLRAPLPEVRALLPGALAGPTETQRRSAHAAMILTLLDLAGAAGATSAQVGEALGLNLASAAGKLLALHQRGAVRRERELKLGSNGMRNVYRYFALTRVMEKRTEQ